MEEGRVSSRLLVPLRGRHPRGLPPLKVGRRWRLVKRQTLCGRFHQSLVKRPLRLSLLAVEADQLRGWNAPNAPNAQVRLTSSTGVSELETRLACHALLPKTLLGHSQFLENMNPRESLGYDRLAFTSLEYEVDLFNDSESTEDGAEDNSTKSEKLIPTKKMHTSAKSYRQMPPLTSVRLYSVVFAYVSDSVDVREQPSFLLRNNCSLRSIWLVIANGGSERTTIIGEFMKEINERRTTN